MLKKIILLLLVSNTLFASSINIAVASNVSYAINSLKKEFNKQYPSIKVNIILGSSGNLSSQIRFGAPYDIFMSANMKSPLYLYENKLAISSPKVYAYGSLAILSSKKRDFSKNIDILEEKNIKRIAIANPKIAPYGMATIKALKNKKIFNKTKSKFIYANSISQTLTYTLKATDIGIVATSLLYSNKMKNYKENIHWVRLDNTLYTPIEQGIVMIKSSKEIQAFYDFILSLKAKEILKSYGYSVHE